MELGACHECARWSNCVSHACLMRICDYKFAVYGFFAEHTGGTRRIESCPDVQLTANEHLTRQYYCLTSPLASNLNQAFRGPCHVKNKLAAVAALFLFAGIMSAQERRSTFRIPFHDAHGRIVLDATLDHKPAALLLDTGASVSFSLAKPGHTIIMVIEHGEPHFETAGNDAPTIGVATLEVRVQGFVGTDVLKRFRAIRIDHKNQVLELEQ